MAAWFGPFRRLSVALGFVGASAAALAGLPVIQSTQVDGAYGTIVVSGNSFGANPVVMLGATRFPTVSATSTKVIASFPPTMPLATLTPGTYFLVMTYTNQLPSVFTVSVGSSGGAQGPAGPAGPMGPAGAAGTTGMAGPPGAKRLSRDV